MRRLGDTLVTCARCEVQGAWDRSWSGFLCTACATVRASASWGYKRREIREFKLEVPTYNANDFEKEVASGQVEEFGDPNVPVLVHEADGVRIVLGTHDYDDTDKPDIQIERRPKGWVIFLHPVGGCDESGLVYFLDDGRSYLRKAGIQGCTPAIEALGADEQLEEMDGPRTEGAPNADSSEAIDSIGADASATPPIQLPAAPANRVDGSTGATRAGSGEARRIRGCETDRSSG